MKLLKKLLMIAIALFPVIGNADTYYALLDPVCVDDPASKVFIDGQTPPFNTPYVSMRYQLPSVTQALNHNASYYTGGPYALTSKNQFGYEDELGAPAIQIRCYDVGVMMNSWTAANVRGWHEGYNTAYSYGFNPKTASPFNSAGSGSLVVQAFISVPTYMPYTHNGIEPIGGLGIDVFLYDRKSKMGFGLNGQVFDNREFAQMYGTTPRFCGIDNTPYCSSALNRDDVYTTPDTNSATWTNKIWSEKRFYRMTVSPRNIINVAKDLNTLLTKKGAKTLYSLDPTDYQLSEVTMLAETSDCPLVTHDCGSRVSMGWSFASLGVYMKVDPPVCSK